MSSANKTWDAHDRFHSPENRSPGQHLPSKQKIFTINSKTSSEEPAIDNTSTDLKHVTDLTRTFEKYYNKDASSTMAAVNEDKKKSSLADRLKMFQNQNNGCSPMEFGVHVTTNKDLNEFKKQTKGRIWISNEEKKKQVERQKVEIEDHSSEDEGIVHSGAKSDSKLSAVNSSRDASSSNM